MSRIQTSANSGFYKPFDDVHKIRLLLGQAYSQQVPLLDTAFNALLRVVLRLLEEFLYVVERGLKNACRNRRPRTTVHSRAIMYRTEKTN